MTDKIYFGHTNDNPLDGLSDASGVLDMLSSFIASCDDLSLFEHNEQNSSMHGLCVVLDSAQSAIEKVYAELLEEKIGDLAERSTNQQPTPKRDLPALSRKLKELLRNAYDAETGDETYPKLPSLSARDTAIAETYRKGYPAEEIASAVNLKQATVNKIIYQLKAAGSIPQEPDDLAHAASA